MSFDGTQVMIPDSLDPVYRSWALALNSIASVSLTLQLMVISNFIFPPYTSNVTLIAPSNSVSKDCCRHWLCHC
jgi:hypothetical protein